MGVFPKNKKSKEDGIKHDGAKIVVVGVGGAGGNAISRMYGDFIKGVDFIAVNTDTQDLEFCEADTRLHIGKNLTKGLGTGMNPDLGRQAAEETRAEIAELLKGADLVFITAGFGGGTGTGAAPVVAEVAKELGALTIAVVTKPFTFEGSQRARIAQEGLVRLKDKVDTMIVIPNDRIFMIIEKDTTLSKAFEAVDNILRSAVQGIAELIAMPGIINVDFADVKAIMQGAGTALVGMGLATGQDRAIASVTQAVNSPLLEASIEGAKGVLFGISGAKDLKMSEVNDIAKIIHEAVDSSAKIIFGAYHNKRMKPGQVKVTLIATGFNGSSIHKTGQLSNLFSAQPDKKSENPLKEMGEVKKADKLEKKDKSFGGAQDKSFGGAQDKQEKQECPKTDVWDIPAFLRKKKK